MTNIFDYLDWRGDISFEQSPINEVDNLIFATISYVDFSGIVPEDGGTITIAEACERLFQAHERSARADTNMFITMTMAGWLALEKAAETDRFSGVALTNYASAFDAERVEQFAAVTMLPDERHAYISFRGTDTSIAGWKEDFYMCFMPSIPSQWDALNYLQSLEHLQDRMLYVGGHSKGGNLAVYAAVNADREIQKRILAVYSNDGPGFPREMLDSDGYRRMSARIKSIVPRSSVVGLLLENEGNYTIIDSAQIGMFQHNALNWQVKGAKFIAAESVSEGSRFFTRTISAWLAEMSTEQRREFVDALFAILEQTGATDFEQFSREKMHYALSLVKSIGNIDPVTRRMMISVIRRFSLVGAENLRGLIAQYGPKWRKREREMLMEKGRDED